MAIGSKVFMRGVLLYPLLRSFAEALGFRGAVGRLAGEQPRLLSTSSSHDHMPVVLDGVVGPPREETSDHSPPVSVDPV